jgi:hypothetical protein
MWVKKKEPLAADREFRVSPSVSPTPPDKTLRSLEVSLLK